MAEVYNQRKPAHRLALGQAMLSTLHEMGLEPAKGLKTFEKGNPKLYRIRVYGDRDVDTGLDLVAKVSLSKTGRVSRDGAAWVRAVYMPQHGQYVIPKTLGEQLVPYTDPPGRTIEAITMDLADALRAEWVASFEVRRCRRCGAPLFRSRRGKQVCADICWEMPHLQTGAGLARLRVKPAPYGTGPGDWKPPPKVRSVEECREEFRALMAKAARSGVMADAFKALVDQRREGNSPEDYCRAARLVEADVVPPDLSEISGAIADLFGD